MSKAIFFLGIDPDYTNPGYAITLGRDIIRVGIFKTGVSRSGITIDIPTDVQEFFSDCICGVEVPILGRTKIFANTRGGLQGRAIGLAKCTLMAGFLISHIGNQCKQTYLIEPIEWNPRKRKKEIVHRELFMVYPNLRKLRATRGNGINDDSIDAVLIAQATQKRFQLNEGKRRMRR